MADELKMNFAALKRVDPYAKGLLETAAHVALYTFPNNEWDKTDIEGALFVYSRTAEPHHNVLIMNRLNMKNLVEPVTQGMDLQLQEPFLLYRTPQGTIFGIWFYDKDECVKIAGTLARIIRESAEVRSQRKVKPSAEPSSVDIFSMLTKAQEEFNSKSPRKTQPGVQSLELNLNSMKEKDSTPKSVIDFFAKASNGSKFSKDSSTPTTIVQPPGMFMSSPRAGPPPGLPRMASVPIAIPPQQQDVRPFLQRLMSNPANTVEHIEKQQQAVTPQNEMAGLLRNGNHILSSSHNTDHNNSLNFNVKSSASVEEPIGNAENRMGFLRISDSPTNSQVVSQQFFNSNLAQKQSPLVNDTILESSMKSESHRPLSAPMESQIKPALMPPVMFTSSVKKESDSDIVTRPSATLNAASSAYQVQPEPLTKNQLLQAVNYLLKHDPDFITKLHEAYVKSFSELVS